MKDNHHGVSRQLKGKNNKRLYSSVCLNNNYTAAWADQSKFYPHTNVSAPSEDQTDEAKDWVDNGSKL
ncbi:CDIF630_02480 family spore surface protein [Intestinibacter sp.]|uniref:CDIF630_02480 family spore surface protein n=1 Tax=Intestinibacter sp. TaxID=1965304 RepID=UPI003F15526E